MESYDIAMLIIAILNLVINALALFKKLLQGKTKAYLS